MNDEPLLHQAVLEEDLNTLEKFSNEPSHFLEANQLGFTAIELAELLGKENCLEVLGKENPESQKIYDFKPITTLRFDSYALLKRVIRDKSLTFAHLALGEEARERGRVLREKLFDGIKAPVFIKKISKRKKFGLFAEKTLPADSLIGEYAGKVVEVPFYGSDKRNAYCFEYQSAFYSFYKRFIDASDEGTLMRFINHSDKPNAEAKLAYDRGLLHVLIYTKEKIEKDQEITLDYGGDYWIKRKKWV